MGRQYKEISYTAPLSTPIQSDAFIAPSDGDWRLIVIPGTPSRKGLYRRFLRTAPDGLEVVVISRPGFARGHRDVVLDWDEQIKAIKPFLDGKKNVVMGVSYGGELALKSALEFDEVKAVVTLSALIDEPWDYLRRLEETGAMPVVRDVIPGRWARVRKEIEGRRTQIGSVLENLKSLNKPVEVIHGDFDALVAKSNADMLMSYLGDKGRLDIIPGGTHYLEFQYPRRIHAGVMRAIDRAGALAL